MRERRVELRHEGGMRFAALTGSGREVALGDDPDRVEYSPVQIVLAALGACSGMDVASIMAKKRQRADSYEIEVTASQRDDYPQVLTRIDIVHAVIGPGVSEEAIRHCIELSATKYCPVSAMLSAGATEIHHRYRVRGTGAAPFAAEGEVVVTGPYRRPDVVP